MIFVCSCEVVMFLLYDSFDRGLFNFYCTYKWAVIVFLVKRVYIGHWPLAHKTYWNAGIPLLELGQNSMRPKVQSLIEENIR